MINKFKNYLNRNGYKVKTQSGYALHLQKFFDYCEKNQINPKRASLDEVYGYVEYLRMIGYKKEGFDSNRYDYKPRTLIEKVKVLKLYYASIKRKDNPAHLVKLEKPETKKKRNLFDTETMLELYLSYIARKVTQKRNKCILGLTLFQGLTKLDMENLELEHLNLEKEEIYVPASTRTNSRYLKLRKSQIAELEDYVFEQRPYLLRESEKKKTSKLFFTFGSGDGFGSLFQRLAKEIRRGSPYFISFRHLRDSRISLWVEEESIREAQYRSGIKYVSSIIKYRGDNTEKLKEKLNVVHPLDAMGL